MTCCSGWPPRPWSPSPPTSVSRCTHRHHRRPSRLGLRDDAPPHIHIIVPGGGISLDGERWVSSSPAFLLPVRVPGEPSGGCSCLEPEEPGRLALHRAGKPQQNAFAESLIGRLRDEYLNETLFTSLRQARVVLADHNRHAASLRAGHAWPCIRTSVGAAGCWAVKLAAWALGLLLELKGDPPCSKADHEFERGGQLGPGGNRGHLFAENFPAGVIRWQEHDWPGGKIFLP
jgi:integrase-like protein/putative transposase